jgi:hypothetical protein
VKEGNVQKNAKFLLHLEDILMNSNNLISILYYYYCFTLFCNSFGSDVSSSSNYCILNHQSYGLLSENLGSVAHEIFTNSDGGDTCFDHNIDSKAIKDKGLYFTTREIIMDSANHFINVTFLYNVFCPGN